jgi:hypothetical protein
MERYLTRLEQKPPIDNYIHNLTPYLTPGPSYWLSPRSARIADLFPPDLTTGQIAGYYILLSLSGTGLKLSLR